MDRPLVVVDTNVFVAALITSRGHNREVLRACLDGRVQALMGHKLFLEYEGLLGRGELFAKSPLSAGERAELLDALMACSLWVEIYFLWRPNLVDEEDNHLMELAVAGGATCIVTNNVRDFKSSELRFPEIRVKTPREFLKEME